MTNTSHIHANIIAGDISSIRLLSSELEKVSTHKIARLPPLALAVVMQLSDEALSALESLAEHLDGDTT